MGRDKAVVELDGVTLLARALATLDRVAAPVVLACGPEPRYAEHGRALALDRVADGGALAGIEAGLARHAAGHVCVLAVDLPAVRPELFAALLARVRDEDLDACLARSPGGLEPLCAVYHTRLLPRIRALLDQGERKVTDALDRRLDGLPNARFSWIDVAPEHGAHTNVNTPADLELLCGREPARKRAS